MARPPIIISNGGIAGELARGFKDEELAEEIIMDNIKRLNKLDEKNEYNPYTVASWINDSNTNSKAPRILWHLNTENDEIVNPKLKQYYGSTAKLGKEAKKQ